MGIKGVDQWITMLGAFHNYASQVVKIIKMLMNDIFDRLDRNKLLDNLKLLQYAFADQLAKSKIPIIALADRVHPQISYQAGFARIHIWPQNCIFNKPESVIRQTQCKALNIYSISYQASRTMQAYGRSVMSAFRLTTARSRSRLIRHE